MTLDLFGHAVEREPARVDPHLDLWARQMAVASLLYYRHDQSFMSDSEFDQMCQWVADAWASLSPLRKFMLGSPGEIRASGNHVKVTRMAEDSAFTWMNRLNVQPSQLGRIRKWTFAKDHQCHWAGINS